MLVRPRDLDVEAANDPMVGRTLDGRYTIVARVGAGSMGTVYRARQHAMGREVAIKILRGDRAVDDSAKARFMREARANSLLASPNTVTVFDFGQNESGEFYLAMELLDGESLGQRLQRVGRVPPHIAVDTARQALRSLSEAHAKGIIHRDLKPDNLFFARVMTGAAPASSLGEGSHEEIVKVLDFGIAKMVNAPDAQAMGVVETQAGTVFGTPRYMSPEQAQGKPLDPRSDLYSLGVILYQMIAGRPPFTDNDAVVVMARHIKSTPKKPSEVCPEAMIPRELEDVLMRTLAKDPTERPGSAEALANELLAAIEAQGALSSGVRASITNAAGIRVPDSMRPPPVALPKPKRSSRWLLALAPIVAVGTGLGVFGLLRGTTEGRTVTTSAGTTPVTLTPPAPSESEPPTLTPDALPTAQSPTAKNPGKSRGKPGAPAAAKTPPSSPGAAVSAITPVAPPPQAASANTPKTPPSSSPYGIFE